MPRARANAEVPMEANDLPPAPEQGPPGGEVTGTPRPTLAQLSRREREVARLIAQGQSNRRIAETLHIGQRTAESHVARVMKKLDCTSRAQVMLWALTAFPTEEATTEVSE
jgi:DNA-binding NarL/FixJ family response regulator